MRFSEDDIRTAAGRTGLGEPQLAALLADLRALPARADAPARFDVVHVLWYAGALIVMGAMGLFTTLAFEMMGGAALTVTGIAYAVAFLLAGRALWRKPDMRTPGGLLIAVAVAMVPLAVYGVQDALGLWGEGGDPGRYRGFFVWVKGSWVPMELATILVGLIAIAFFPVPFIVFVIAVALWFLSMDLAPWILGVEELTFAVRRRVSMLFGLAVLGVAWLVDLRRRPQVDTAFWLHLAGLAAFWGGLTLAESSTEAGKALYALLNVGLIGLAVFLMRRAYAVFGALGVSTYLGHLAQAVFEDSLLFPFALSAIGIAIIAGGLWLHRRREAISAWMAARLPPAIAHLRPPHALHAA